MLNTITNELSALGTAMIVNMLLGMYYNINLRERQFDINSLVTGVIKAVIIGVSFIGIAYCFDVTDLSQIGISPDLVINAALVLYITKSLQNLMKILGVEPNNLNRK